MKWREIRWYEIRFLSTVLVWIFRLRHYLNKSMHRLWYHLWYHLWIRGNEFHRSLDLNPEKMAKMNGEEREKYLDNLYHKRKIAHQKDIGEI